MPKRQSVNPTRVPRADKLNLVRDILHILAKYGNVLTVNLLFAQTKEHFVPPKTEVWKRDTFNEYITFLKRLKLAIVTPVIVRILERGESLVGCSKYGQEELGDFEKQIFKQLLLSYPPFRDFLSVTFCGGQPFSNMKELFERSKCPRRTEMLKKYLIAYNQKDDREARTMFYWGTQVGLIEFDGYHDSLFLVNPRNIDPDFFLHQLSQACNETRDLKTGIALIPEVRFRICCAQKISRRVFDDYLIRSFNEHPTNIELGKGSISRTEVVKYGITYNKNHYYYIRMAKRVKR